MTNFDVSIRARFLNQLGSGARAAESDLKRVGNAARELGKGSASHKFGSDLAKASGQAKATRAAVTDLRRETERLGTARGGARAAQDISKLGTAARAAKADVAALAREQAKVGVGKVGGGKGVAAATGGVTAGEVGAGAAVARLGMRVVAPLGVGYVTKKAFDQSVNADTAWAEILKKVNDASPEQFQALKKTILDLSFQLGIARTEMMGLTAEAAAAGIVYKDLSTFMQLVGKDAVAWDMSPREAAKNLAFIKAATGKTIAEMTVLSEKINGLADNSSASEKDIVDMFLRVGAAAREAGVKEDDALAILTAVRSGGMEPEVVSRWFGAFAGGLRTAEESPERVDEGLKMLGLTAEKVAKGMKTDAMGTILDLFDRLTKSEDAATAATKIWGREWWDETLRAKGGIAEINKQVEFLKNPANFMGSLDKNLELKLATAKSHLEKMNELVSRIGEGLSKWSIDPFNWMVDKAIDKFQQMQDRLDNSASWWARWTAEEEARLTAKGDIQPMGTTGQRFRPMPDAMDTPEWIKSIRKWVYGDERTADVVASEWLFGEAGRKSEQSDAAKQRGAFAGLGELHKAKAEAEAELAAATRAREAAAALLETTPMDRSALMSQDLEIAEERRAKARAKADEATGAVSRALQSPDVASAVKAEMDRYAQALQAGGEKATEIARRIAAELQQILSFTARPTIAPAGAGSGVGGSGAGQTNGSPGKQSSLGGPSTTVHQHIRGADPRAIARASQREQDRAVRRAVAGSMHDLGGSWA
jgi:TP901 family phage tail tape measure protein